MTYIFKKKVIYFKNIIFIMSSKRNFAIRIFNSDKITEINSIITDYGEITTKSSSHMLFNTVPISDNDIAEDITFFSLKSEDEDSLNSKLDELISEINKLNTEYTLMDSDSEEMIMSVKYVGAFDIKFDHIESIKKGAYEKIDKLKQLKSEYGICKGYKPSFHPIETTPIKKDNVKKETIYVFCNSEENLSELKELLTQKVKEIDPDFEVGFRLFT